MKKKVTFMAPGRRNRRIGGNNLSVVSFALDSNVGFYVLNANDHLDNTQLAGFTGEHSFY